MVEIQELQAQGLGQEAPWTSLWGDDTAELLLSPRALAAAHLGDKSCHLPQLATQTPNYSFPPLSLPPPRSEVLGAGVGVEYIRFLERPLA